MMSEEIPALFGVSNLSEERISHLSDNVILLHFVRQDGQLGIGPRLSAVSAGFRGQPLAPNNPLLPTASDIDPTSAKTISAGTTIGMLTITDMCTCVSFLSGTDASRIRNPHNYLVGATRTAIECHTTPA